MTISMAMNAKSASMNFAGVTMKVVPPPVENIDVDGPKSVRRRIYYSADAPTIDVSPPTGLARGR
jgi:hypothetical protein